MLGSSLTLTAGRVRDVATGSSAVRSKSFLGPRPFESPLSWVTSQWPLGLTSKSRILPRGYVFGAGFAALKSQSRLTATLPPIVTNQGLSGLMYSLQIGLI